MNMTAIKRLGPISPPTYTPPGPGSLSIYFCNIHVLKSSLPSATPCIPSCTTIYIWTSLSSTIRSTLAVVLYLVTITRTSFCLVLCATYPSYIILHPLQQVYYISYPSLLLLIFDMSWPTNLIFHKYSIVPASSSLCYLILSIYTSLQHTSIPPSLVSTLTHYHPHLQLLMLHSNWC